MPNDEPNVSAISAINLDDSAIDTSPSLAANESVMSSPSVSNLPAANQPYPYILEELDDEPINGGNRPNNPASNGGNRPNNAARNGNAASNRTNGTNGTNGTNVGNNVAATSEEKPLPTSTKRPPTNKQRKSRKHSRKHSRKTRKTRKTRK